MKIIKNLKLFLFLAIMLCFFSADEMKAATSYTDAKTLDNLQKIVIIEIRGVFRDEI